MKRTMRTLILLVVLVVVLALPMLACAESGLEPPADTVNERGILHTMKVAKCSRLCHGDEGCIHICVNGR